MRHANVRVVSPMPSFEKEIHILYIVSIMFIQLVIVGYTSNVWFEYNNSCARLSTLTLYSEICATTLILYVSYYDGWYQTLKSNMMELAMSLITIVYAWSAIVVFSDCKVYQCLNLSSVCVTLWTTIITIAIMLNGFNALYRMLMWDNENILRHSKKIHFRYNCSTINESDEEDIV